MQTVGVMKETYCLKIFGWKSRLRGTGFVTLHRVILLSLRAFNPLYFLSGDVLIQISESQRRLNMELEGVVSSINVNHIFSCQRIGECPPLSDVLCVTLCACLQFRKFTVDVIQQMDGNIKLDRDYLTVSEGRSKVKAVLS